MFYLLAEGGTSKCNGNVVTGIGRSKAQRIWYEAITNRMTASTNYDGARIATLGAAIALGYPKLDGIQGRRRRCFRDQRQLSRPLSPIVQCDHEGRRHEDTEYQQRKILSWSLVSLVVYIERFTSRKC